MEINSIYSLFETIKRLKSKGIENPKFYVVILSVLKNPSCNKLANIADNEYFSIEAKKGWCTISLDEGIFTWDSVFHIQPINMTTIQEHNELIRPLLPQSGDSFNGEKLCYIMYDCAIRIFTDEEEGNRVFHNWFKCKMTKSMAQFKHSIKQYFKRNLKNSKVDIKTLNRVKKQSKKYMYDLHNLMLVGV